MGNSGTVCHPVLLSSRASVIPRLTRDLPIFLGDGGSSLRYARNDRTFRKLFRQSVFFHFIE